MPTERSVKCVYMHGCVCGCVFGWVGVCLGGWVCMVCPTQHALINTNKSYVCSMYLFDHSSFTLPVPVVGWIH